ncbi:uncharacterized protein C8Q71DRAFT_849659 [Rhodofomes roseus]|uniref:Transmembrane protein n=1 Tax=Rhodofomes roseus TaxID=34475 RepID=A0ABQ8K9D5_9APHY|nr:uncharacterized protein C8Q71DRAFT_849659 [Rhodofomes roseus]KAH9833727.1 hypothetical protein C8Q71DRAFT_849659 [Rhodofomes roseus]
MSSNSTVVVYANDPSLNYSRSAWTTVSYPSSNVTLAVAKGAASGTLKFNGTQIAVYGVLETGQPVTSTYSIDGSSAESYTGPSDLTSQQFEVVLFLSPELSSDQHELSINVVNATSNAPYILEFILYIPTSTDVSGATYSSTSLHGSTATIVVSNATASSAAPVGAIVGGVVGGVAGLMILGLATYFFLRQKLARKGRPYFYEEVGAGEMLQDDIKPTDLPMAAVTVTPYPTDAASSSAPSRYSDHPAPSASESESAAYPAAPPGLGAPAGGSVHSQLDAPRSPQSTSYASHTSGQRPTLTLVGGSDREDDYASPDQPRGKAAEAGLLSIGKETTYYQDSGLRFNARGDGPSTVEEVPTDVPPSYSEH